MFLSLTTIFSTDCPARHSLLCHFFCFFCFLVHSAVSVAAKSLLGSGLRGPVKAIVFGKNRAGRRAPLSVDPGHRNPLRCCVDSLDRRLQGGDRLLYVVVHDSKVEKVSVCLPQHIRFFCQSFQASVVLKEWF